MNEARGQPCAGSLPRGGLRRDEGSVPHLPDGAAGTGSRPRPRVLIVDDHEDTREMYAWCMRASGWHVATVPDGVEAIAAASTFKPDVIVMDLRLPLVDGVDAIRCLRADALTAAIPIVACTGAGRASAEAEARAAGCDEFVEKPCPPDELCALLERLVTSGA